VSLTELYAVFGPAYTALATIIGAFAVAVWGYLVWVATNSLIDAWQGYVRRKRAPMATPVARDELMDSVRRRMQTIRMTK
jgi:hypothetical protein